MDSLQLQYAEFDIKYGMLDRQMDNLINIISSQTNELKKYCPHLEFRKEEYDDYHNWYTYYVCTECGYDTRDIDKKTASDNYLYLREQRSKLLEELKNVENKMKEWNDMYKKTRLALISACPHSDCVTIDINRSTKKCKLCLSEIRDK